MQKIARNAFQCKQQFRFQSTTAVPLFTHSIEIQHQQAGKKKSAIVVLHGLLGSGLNYTTLLKKEAQEVDGFLSNRAACLVPDARNHGHSTHNESHKYMDLCADLLHLLDTQQIEECVLIAHSMGAKQAMHFCLMHAERVQRAVFLDCAPCSYVNDKRWEPHRILQAMQQVDLSQVKQRNDVNVMLKDSVPDSQMRMFLLTNLISVDNAWRWRVNLPALNNHIMHIGGFETSSNHKPFDKPALFLGGSRSYYIQEEYGKCIAPLFPQAQVELVANAGHWIHVEQPQAFVQATRQFLKE